jgi:hypothetical protein
MFDGEIFIQLCTSYINSLNNGELPNIEHAWFYVCKNECIKAIKCCVALVDKHFKDKNFTLT